METDDEFAARMRARRGEPPLRRVAPWRQLLDLSIANVHEMIMTPGVVLDDGVIEELEGIVDVLSRGDATNMFTGEFAVHTKLNVNGDYEDAVVERHVRRVLHTGDPGNVGWWLMHEASPKLAAGEHSRAFVHFNVERYAEIVKTLRRMSASDALVLWIMAFEAEDPILMQHTLPNERVIGARAGWYVSKVEAPGDLRMKAMLRSLSIEFVAAKDGDERATLWLAKREGSWLDHDGKLATPWGAINVANGPPWIRAGSQLERELAELERGGAGAVTHITTAVWTQGLEMPSFDRGLVRRILDAQTVLVEVPLAA